MNDNEKLPKNNNTYKNVRDYSKPIFLKLEGEQVIQAMIEIITSPKTRYDAKTEAEKAKAELRKQGLDV